VRKRERGGVEESGRGREEERAGRRERDFEIQG